MNQFLAQVTIINYQMEKKILVFFTFQISKYPHEQGSKRSSSLQIESKYEYWNKSASAVTMFWARYSTSPSIEE